MIETIAYILFFITVLIAYYYLYFISNIYDIWEKTEETYIQKPIQIHHSFSIIIAARNEEYNIERCLKSLSQIKYPNDSFEIIVVDDHSEDKTQEIVHNFPSVILVRSEGEGKKKAIQTGITQATKEFIITIDADCEVHPDLLYLYNAKLIDTKNLHFVAGGVIMSKNKLYLGYFQSLDMLSLMAATVYGISMGKYYLANGANMCFKKSSFVAVRGFLGNDHLSSGDDVFLINKIKQTFGQDSVGFLKSKRGAVKTIPIQNVKEFVSQRWRWASKTKAYANQGLIIFQGTVFGIHLFGFLLVVTSFFIPLSFFCFLLHMMIKGIIDYLFLNKMASFYDEKWALKGFIPSSLIYYPYIFITSLSSLFSGGYIWKGRSLK